MLLLPRHPPDEMNVMGKIARGAARRITNEPYLTSSAHMQLGGKPHIPVLYGPQALRTFLNSAKRQNLSTSILFADVQSAYYKVLRELATGSDEMDLDFRQILARFHLND